MITGGKKWHYLAVKSLTALLKEITSKHKGDFCCLNRFLEYATKNKLQSHKKVCQNYDSCCVEMPNEDNKILKYNHGEKSMKHPIIRIIIIITHNYYYADLESLLEKISTCYDSPEKSSTSKINKHTRSGYLLFTYCSFDERKNELSQDRGKNYMKDFCLDLREHATKIINSEKKK